MTAREVLAIDPSLTGTAVVGPSRTAELTAIPQRKIAVKKLAGVQRLIHIRDEIHNLIDPLDLPLIIIEGYAYGRTNQAHQLGELGGVLRTMFEEAGCGVVEITPNTLKKFVTGKGNAGKDLMVATVTHRTGQMVASNDIADAIGLYCVGRQLLKLPHPMGELPATHLAALDKVTA